MYSAYYEATLKVRTEEEGMVKARGGVVRPSGVADAMFKVAVGAEQVHAPIFTCGSLSHVDVCFTVIMLMRVSGILEPFESFAPVSMLRN